MIFVRRRVGEAFKPECVVPTIKHDGGSKIVWGCMTDSGVSQLFICEGHINSTKYINVLESALLPSFMTLFGITNIDGVQFQQDNAPCHKSAHTMTWFRENCIELLYWPAQSLDLSPIEHLWGLLKTRVRYHTINNKEELKHYLCLEWNTVTPEECRNLINCCIQKRISAVIKSKGGPTKN